MKNILAKHANLIGAWLALLAAAFLLQRVNLWALGIGLYLAYKCLSPYLSRTTFSSRLYQAVTVFLLYTLLHQCIIIVVWLISPNTPLHLATYATALLLGGMYMHTRKHTLGRAGKTQFINRYDVVALLLTILVMGIVVGPSILFRDGFRDSSVMQIVNANVDDASHIALFNDHLAFDRGILTNADTPGGLRNSTMYPAGWHSLNADLVKSISPDIQAGSDSLLAYAITKVLWLGFLVFVAFRFGLQIAANYARKKHLSYVECIAFALVAGFFLQVFVHVYIEGFYSFLPQIMYGILLLSLLSQLSTNRPSSPQENITATLPLVFLAAAGGCLTWLLPAPAIAAFLVVLVLGYIVGSKWKTETLILIRKSLHYLPIYMLIVLAALTQYYVLAHDTSPGAVSLLDGLLMPGGVTVYNAFFYLALAIGVVVFFVMAHRHQKKNDHFAFSTQLLIACMLCFISLICLYQQIKINTNAYYYYKLLCLLAAIVTPLAVAGYASLIRTITSSGWKPLTYAVLIFGVLLNFVGFEPTAARDPLITYPAYLAGTRKISQEDNKLIYQHLKNVATMSAYSNKEYYFLHRIDGPYIDTIEVLLKTNKPLTDCFESIRATFIKGESIEATDRAAEQKCKDKRIYLIVSDTDKERLNKKQLRNLHPITYDQAIQSTPSKQ